MARVLFLLPDPGVAALLRREWGVPAGAVLPGLKEIRDGATLGPYPVIVVPNTTEGDKVQAAVEAADFLPVKVAFPRLVGTRIIDLALIGCHLRGRLNSIFVEAPFLHAYPLVAFIWQHPGE